MPKSYRAHWMPVNWYLLSKVRWYLLIKEMQEYTEATGITLAHTWVHVHDENYNNARASFTKIKHRTHGVHLPPGHAVSPTPMSTRIKVLEAGAHR